MSRGPSTPTPTTGRFLSVDAQVQEVAATVASLPAAIAGAVSARIRDFNDHHRRSVLKRAKGRFDARDRAVRMIASRMFSRAKREDRIEKVEGESFMAGRDTVGPVSSGALETFERGGTVNSRGWMAVPIGAGRPYAGVFQTLPIWARTKQGLKDFLYVERDGRVYVVDDRRSSITRARKKSAAGAGSFAFVDGESGKGVVVGMLVKSRRQGKRLEFMQAADEIWPKHQARIDKDVALAGTEAGRATLIHRNKTLSQAGNAWRSAFQNYLTANPGRIREAREAGRQAFQAVMTQGRLGGGGRV